MEAPIREVVKHIVRIFQPHFSPHSLLSEVEVKIPYPYKKACMVIIERRLDEPKKKILTGLLLLGLYCPLLDNCLLE